MILGLLAILCRERLKTIFKPFVQKPVIRKAVTVMILGFILLLLAAGVSCLFIMNGGPSQLLYGK